MSRLLCTLGFVLLLLVLEPACRKKKAAVPLPSPPAAAAKIPEEEKPATNPEPAPAPAPISTVPAQTPTPGTTTPTPAPAPKPAEGSGRYQQNRPPQTTQPARKPSRQTPAAAATPPASAPPPAATPAAPAPQLGDILTPDQQREYNAAIDQSLAHAQSSLGSIANRQLSKEQQSTLDQIRNFIQQAQETRKSDLQGAKSLAERAEVLARDLATSLK